jgi:ATP-binding cassette subfamily B (MDR/TAP) protein 1
LILCATIVALVLDMTIGSGFMLANNKMSLESYARGGNLADEVLGSIRSAVAFGTQERLAKKYESHLLHAEFYGFKVKRTLSMMTAGMMMIFYLNYALAFWQGSKFLIDGETGLSNVLIVTMSIMLGKSAHILTASA